MVECVAKTWRLQKHRDMGVSKMGVTPNIPQKSIILIVGTPPKKGTPTFGNTGFWAALSWIGRSSGMEIRAHSP